MKHGAPYIQIYGDTKKGDSMVLMGRGNFPSVLSPLACLCERGIPIPVEAWVPLITIGLTNVNMRPINGRSPTIFAQHGSTRSNCKLRWGADGGRLFFIRNFLLG